MRRAQTFMPLFTPNISVFRVALAVLIAATALGAAEKPRFLTPEESLAALQLEPGLRIDLVAANRSPTRVASRC